MILKLRILFCLIVYSSAATGPSSTQSPSSSSTTTKFRNATVIPEDKRCTIDSQCHANEMCQMRNSRSRFGLCVCKPSFQSDGHGKCVIVNVTSTESTVSMTTKSDHTEAESSTANISREVTDNDTSVNVSTVSPKIMTPETIRKLFVSTDGNKELQLPENKISLSAYAIADDSKDEDFKYEWTLIRHPSNDDTSRDEGRHTNTIQLYDLKQGLYTFKVQVTAVGAFGEQYVNVTVKPPKRKNKPPVAIISPENSTISLPNTDAVLDGSASTDDEKIVKYHWETVLSPLTYQSKLSETATLQLKDLKAGFYQFKLTVTDSDGILNSTIANVTVLKEVDYPPVANAGEDVVLVLPNNHYVLNGNLSTDDKGIKSWEWTKSGDTKLPVDASGTQTPFLKLSNLQKGMYEFVLKVTDDAGQSSTAKVHIFVKELKNQPPKPNAGLDVQVDLNVKSVTLDGSATQAEDQATYKWTQLSGPNEAKFENSDKQISKAYDLTVGKYEFQLEVIDSQGQSAKDTLVVTVKQTKNVPPKANAGGDKTVVLPVSVVYLNGSLSSDDRGIKTYKWTRDPSSLAAGEIIEDSDSKAILKMINLIAGRYIFSLTVTDDQGTSSTDTVSLIVKGPANFKDRVQMTLNVDLKSYTQANKETMKEKLELLLNEGSSTKVVISKIFSDLRTGRVVIIFTVYVNAQIVKGPDVVMRLRQKVTSDNLLDFHITALETVVCQNNCSHHGTCEPYTKRCVCDAFWMENFFRVHLGDQQSNCDWSILYVIIAILFSIISCVGLTWVVVCYCKRKKKKLKTKKRHRYTLLETTDDGDELDILSKGKLQKSSLMRSESDTDSDSLFERSRLKPSNGNGHLKMNGSTGNKLSRQIKA